jgi:hypothetical protein
LADGSAKLQAASLAMASDYKVRLNQSQMHHSTLEEEVKGLNQKIVALQRERLDVDAAHRKQISELNASNGAREKTLRGRIGDLVAGVALDNVVRGLQKDVASLMATARSSDSVWAAKVAALEEVIETLKPKRGVEIPGMPV